MAKHVAIKRLLTDLKEVLEQPMEQVAALPLDDNLLVWRANLRCADGLLAHLPIHALLVFPDTYPTNGPEIRLFHAMPHPNVAIHLAPPEEAHGAAYRVQLFDCNPSLDQWNPAYSVASTLILLHSFLLGSEMLYDTNKISIDATRKAALSHGSAGFPRFATAQDIALAPRLRKMDVRRPPVNKELMLALPDVVPAAAQAAADHDGWMAVGSLGIKQRAAARASAGDSPATHAPISHGASGFALLEGLGEEEEQEAGEDAADVAPAEVAVEASVAGAAEAAAGRRTHRRSLMDASILGASHRSLIANVMAAYRRGLEGERGAKAAKLAMHADAIQAAADHREAALEGASAGPCFDVLTPDALAQVLVRMDASDVAALGATCRGLCAACADGEVWRAQLLRSFPASHLRCADLADYRLAFHLEANGVVPELACFYSRATFETEVLGTPYQFTVNPKTQRVDYILPTTPDLVCVEAVRGGLVRCDPAGNDIQGCLPAFITQEHFERGLPFLPEVLRQLCPADPRPSPEAWLTIIPTMLNTCVVMLCDHGLEASERALNTYCGLHRLLLALCDRYGLWAAAERRVARFLSAEAQRTKAETPSLGFLVPLLALSRRHNWRQVLPVVLGEALDRQVLWACKEDRSLVARYQAAPSRGGVDGELVTGAFKASSVSLRLLMFHSRFLALVGRPAGQSIGEVMYRLDSMYGRPGAGLRRRFQGVVKDILECGGWDQVLDLMGLMPLSPAAWTARLRQSWQNSLAKHYHDRRTNFDRVQAGGVSRILLRGQRYSAPPNLAAIEVDQRWHSLRGGFKYLDASCLIYGRRRGDPPSAPPRFLEAVDYSGTCGAAGGVRHSGDMIDGANGQHTLSINLGRLPAGVEALFLTMSSWAGARLNDIDQPFISVRDPASGMELCQFSLDDVPAAQRAAHSSVVMIKVFRGAVAGRWEIQAIGQLGGGDASDYDPVDSWIQSTLVPVSASAASAATRR